MKQVELMFGRVSSGKNRNFYIFENTMRKKNKRYSECKIIDESVSTDGYILSSIKINNSEKVKQYLEMHKKEQEYDDDKSRRKYRKELEKFRIEVYKNVKKIVVEKMEEEKEKLIFPEVEPAEGGEIKEEEKIEAPNDLKGVRKELKRVYGKVLKTVEKNTETKLKEIKAVKKQMLSYRNFFYEHRKDENLSDEVKSAIEKFNEADFEKRLSEDI